MNDREVGAPHTSIWTVALVGLACLFAFIAVRYAVAQSVWTDEATQLSGLSLGIADQLRWLVGRLPQAFAVPPDRTPPLSYWLGSLWAQIFGIGALTARCLSVSLSVASVIAVWVVARQWLDGRIALIGAALLALSPNLLVEAVEIRAYATFIFVSILLIYSYLKLRAATPYPSRNDLWAFALAATLCSYTHFFGIVISAGAFLCLLPPYLSMKSRTALRDLVRKAGWPLLFYVLGLVGLIPFVLAAAHNSGGAEVSTAAVALPLNDIIQSMVKLIYRLFGHQAMLGIAGLSASAMLAGITLLVFSTIPGSDPRARQLLLFFLVNLTLVTIVGLTTRAFNAFASTYNVWALPVVALLAATGLVHKNRLLRVTGTLCVGVLIAADSYAAIRLSTSGEIYGHTRSTEVKNAVDAAGAGNVLVLYANDAPSIYFALMYDYSGSLRQFIDRGRTVESIGPAEVRSSSTICDLDAPTLVVVRDQQLSAEALQFLIAHPNVHTQAYQGLQEFLNTHRAEVAAKWTLVSQNDYLAQSALALAVFKGRTVGVTSSPPGCSAP